MDERRCKVTVIRSEARILAVVDAYEAMIAERPYRQAMAPDEAREELLRCAGSQFDPVVVDAFLSELAGEDQADRSRLSDAA